MLEHSSAADAMSAVDCVGPAQIAHRTALHSLILDRAPVRRRQLRPKQALFRAGQPFRSLFLVHAGTLKTSMLSEDGREKVTGFRLPGDLLGIDSIGVRVYGCDAIALDICEVREIPLAWFDEKAPELLPLVAAKLAEEVRRDWRWMLSLGTLNAEQRVVAFLLDHAARIDALGFSARRIVLRMTRADIGSFLALQLETVTRVLSHLASLRLIAVDGRTVFIERPERLRAMIDGR